jgi:hypothetical protein
MRQTTSPPRYRHLLRELVVPALMLASIGLFLGGSRQLSFEAMLLPAGLIIVVVAALIWALVPAFLNPHGPAVDASAEKGEDEDIGPILHLKSWLLVAIPAALMAVVNELGALTMFVALVIGAQFVFGVKTPVRSVLIAIAVTAPTYAIFKYVLYARFPAGLLGLG